MSIKELYEKINKNVFSIAFESNPIRKGWELHKIDYDDVPLKDNPNFYDKYYLIECYSETLTEDEADILYSYADGLMQKSFENYMSGRTSLAEQLKPMSDWEERFKKHDEIINRIIEKREKFINENKA